MAMNNIQNKYLEDSVMTATPQQLTLMLYNGCIKNMNVAKQAMQAKEIEKTNEGLVKAQRIILELRTTLDESYPISKQLSALYTYIWDRLVEANIKKECEQLDIAMDMVTELRDTWFEAMKLSKSANGSMVG
jgi:flagellar protein FliS